MKRVMAISLLVLAAMSGMAQTHISNQDSMSDPKAQALKLYLAIQRQDWKSMFLLTLFSPNVRKEMGSDADGFATGVRAGINSEKDGQKTIDDLLNNLSEITVADPVINGDKADVTTSSKLTINGRPVVFKGTAHMIKDKDVWKWDLTFSDDTKARLSRAFWL